MELVDSLTNLGLTEKEARAYLALLELGSASVYSLAQRSGLKRPTAYVIIDELIKKGVATQIPRIQKKLYQVKPPEELIGKAENKLWLIKQKLPELQALAKGQNNKPRTYYFEGLHGVQQAMQYGLKRLKGKEVQVFWATATQKTLEQFGYFKDFNNTLKALGIKLRGTVPQDPILKEFRKTDNDYGRTLKELAKDRYSPTVSIDLGDTYVKIIDYDNLQSIIIENGNITKTLKQIFEIVWKAT
jgi:sugar-specific transcriptional regulator TrmB